jgi:hypothetical protein
VTRTVIEFRGVRATLAEHCRRLGLPSNRVYGRLHLGWPIERALSEPIVPRGKNRDAAPATNGAVAHDDDGREFATVAPATVAEPDPRPPLSRPFVDRTPHPKLEVQPARTVAALPRGTVAAVAEAAELIQFVADLLQAPETLPLRRADLLERCRGWLVRGGAA